MINTFRSMFIAVYKAKAVVALCTAIAAILFLSAYIGSNTFFNQGKEETAAGVFTHQELYNQKNITSDAVSTQATTSDSAPDQSEPLAPTTTSTVKIEDEPKKAICDETVKNSLIQERRTKTESENTLHAANILAIQKSISSVGSVVNTLLQEEDQRHATVLTLIESDYLTKLHTASCQRL